MGRMLVVGGGSSELGAFECGRGTIRGVRRISTEFGGSHFIYFFVLLGPAAFVLSLGT